MKNRWDVLYNLVKQNNYNVFVEVGVFKGDTSRFLLANIPDLKIYAIDSYCDYPSFKPKKVLMSDIKKLASDVLNHEGCVFMDGFSKDMVGKFDDNSLDIVFIDANHTFSFVNFDIHAWWNKVRSGGILSGHDYWVGGRKNKPVKKAVDLFQKEIGIELCLCDDGVWYFKK